MNSKRLCATPYCSAVGRPVAIALNETKRLKSDGSGEIGQWSAVLIQCDGFGDEGCRQQGPEIHFNQSECPFSILGPEQIQALQAT